MFRILDEIARAMISGKCLFLRGFWFCTARAVGSGRSRNARRTLRPRSSIRNADHGILRAGTVAV